MLTGKLMLPSNMICRFLQDWSGLKLKQQLTGIMLADSYATVLNMVGSLVSVLNSRFQSLSSKLSRQFGVAPSPLNELTFITVVVLPTKKATFSVKHFADIVKYPCLFSALNNNKQCHDNVFHNFLFWQQIGMMNVFML